MGIKGFTKRDDRSPKGRGASGHETSKYWQADEDKGIESHDDLRKDFEGMRHRELSQEGELRIGYKHAEGKNTIESAESNQNPRPYEERVQRATIAGTQIKAADPEHAGADLHYAKNKFMEGGSKTGAKKEWKPKGRGAAEKASEDV